MPPETLVQVREMVLKSLRTVPGPSPIREGPQEPYITFTDHLQTALNRQVELPATAEALLKSLAY